MWKYEETSNFVFVNWQISLTTQPIKVSPKIVLAYILPHSISIFKYSDLDASCAAASLDKRSMY